MLDIGIECRDNVWYFIRELARAPAVAGTNDSLFRANRSNISLFWLFFNHVTNILIQPRQTGKSFGTHALADFLLNIGAQNTLIGLLTKDDNLRSETLDKLRDFEGSLPEFVVQRTKRDISNSSEIGVESLNNSMKAMLSSSSEKIAFKVGRGFTSPVFIIDEPVYIPNIAIALPAALAAGGEARESAKVNNAPYGTILTTTAGKKDDKDGKYVYVLLQNSLPWDEKLFDSKNEEDLYGIIRKNNRGIVRINSTFNHRQLGYTDEWLKERMETALAEGEDAERDFLNKWTSGNDRSPLTPELLERIRTSEIEPSFVEITNDSYVISWYMDEIEIEYKLNNGAYILGVDTSNASGGDAIALVLIDSVTGKNVFTASINETNLINFSMWLVNLLVKYKGITAIIENRSTGPVIIDYLTKMLPSYGEDPYKRLFNRVINDKALYPDKFKYAIQPLGRKDEDMLVRDKKHFGFSTSGSGLTSRSELYGTTLQNAAKRIGDRVYNAKLINEIMGLVRRNDRVDHDIGCHDDLVIAWLLAFWLLSSGENLDVYGIKPHLILTGSSSSVAVVENVIDQYDLIQDNQSKQEIDELLEKIKNVDDDNLSHIYEKRIKFLTSQLKNKSLLNNISIDDVLNKIHEQKRINRMYTKNNVVNQPTYNVRPSYETNSYLWGTAKW